MIVSLAQLIAMQPFPSALPETIQLHESDKHVHVHHLKEKLLQDQIEATLFPLLNASFLHQVFLFLPLA